MNGELEFRDTSNQFAVGVNGLGNVVVNSPLGGALTPAQALNLAAWIVALVDPEQECFKLMLDAILFT
jgi:hypothetical protein